MGIDFSGFIANLGKTAASMQNDKEKIDTKTELNTYVSGWDAIKAKAEAENAQAAIEDATNIQELEGQMKSELASLMGAEFGQKAGVQNKGTAKEPVFSDEDISLENMMALLEPEEGLDLAKVRENNEKPINIVEEMNVVENMNEFGFDPELTEVILEYEPAAAQYISDAIKDGRADEIGKNATIFEKEFGETMDMAGLLFANADYTKNIKTVRDTLNKMRSAKSVSVNNLVESYKNETDPVKKAEIREKAMRVDRLYDERIWQLEALADLEELGDI